MGSRRNTLVAVGWLIVGALGTLGVYGIFTIGALLIAAALVLAAALHRIGKPLERHAVALTAFGGVFALIFFGFAQLPYRPCTARDFGVSSADNGIWECGGANPLIHFLPAAALLAVAALAVFIGRRRGADAWLAPRPPSRR